MNLVSLKTLRAGAREGVRMENVLGHILSPQEGALRLLSLPTPSPAVGWLPRQEPQQQGGAGRESECWPSWVGGSGNRGQGHGPVPDSSLVASPAL